MNNKQLAENFLNLAKEAEEYGNLATFERKIKIAQVHALLAIAEAQDLFEPIPKGTDRHA